MKLGKRPGLEKALAEVERVGNLVGGEFAARMAVRLRLIQEKLKERSKWGPDGVSWRGVAASLQLQADAAEHGFKQRQAVLGAKALSERLEVLEAQAIRAEDILDLAAVRLQLESVVAEEVASLQLDPRSGGKSFFFPADRDADAERLIRAIGGYRERGAEPGPGGFDEIHLGRALALIAGDVEPDGEAERKALDRWRRKYGTSP